MINLKEKEKIKLMNQISRIKIKIFAKEEEIKQLKNEMDILNCKVDPYYDKYFLPNRFHNHKMTYETLVKDTQLVFTARTYRCLCTYHKDKTLKELFNVPHGELRRIRDFGQKSLNEVIELSSIMKYEFNKQETIKENTNG